MKHSGFKQIVFACMAALLLFASGTIAAAQDQSQDQRQTQDQAPDATQDRTQEEPGVMPRARMPQADEASPVVPQPGAHPADGRRHADLPVQAYAVAPG